MYLMKVKEVPHSNHHLNKTYVYQSRVELIKLYSMMIFDFPNFRSGKTVKLQQDHYKEALIGEIISQFCMLTEYLGMVLIAKRNKMDIASQKFSVQPKDIKSLYDDLEKQTINKFFSNYFPDPLDGINDQASRNDYYNNLCEIFENWNLIKDCYNSIKHGLRYYILWNPSIPSQDIVQTISDIGWSIQKKHSSSGKVMKTYWLKLDQGWFKNVYRMAQNARRYLNDLNPMIKWVPDIDDQAKNLNLKKKETKNETENLTKKTF